MRVLLTHTYISLYIYVYVCACVCLQTTDDYNDVTCAELPDKKKHPVLLSIISRRLMHGAVGKDGKRSCQGKPCADKVNPDNPDQCLKRFPKEYCQATKQLEMSGYPEYQRRDLTMEAARGTSGWFRTIGT